MDDFPQRIADLLVSAADRVRSLTVDRAARAVKWIAAGPLLTVLAVIAILFLGIGIFRVLAELIGTKVTYAVLGGLLALGALFLWIKRTPRTTEDST